VNRLLRAAAAYFGLAFGTGFVLGAIRVPFLVPRLGARTAELVEMPVMCGVIFLAARWVVRHFLLRGLGSRLTVGLVAFVLLVAAELGLAYLMQGLDPVAYVCSRDPVSGTVYALAIVLLALMPSLVGPANERRSAAH
jgi:lipid-A-disaccharide synthase-like uncharacterized protein